MDDATATPGDWRQMFNERIATSAMIERFVDAGEVLCRQGEPGGDFFVVLDGSADVLRHGELIGELTAGSVVGELALLTGAVRNATVQACTDMRVMSGTLADLEHLMVSSLVREHLLGGASWRLAVDMDPIALDTGKGFIGAIRPLRASDRATYVDALHSLSKESYRRRFFSSTPLSDSLIDYFLDIDYVNHFAWVAFSHPTAPTAAAVSRFVRDNSRRHVADLSVTVTDAFHGQGLGTAMIGALAVAADALGVTTFTAEALEENRAMKAILSHGGAHWQFVDRGVVATEVEVAKLSTLVSPLLRSAVTERLRPVALRPWS
jgi:protein lysine acetyltransferase